MSEGIHAITMPKWGLAMTEGMVAEWHIEPGSAFAKGDELLDIETAKITNALEAPVSSVLRRTVVAADETVPVGALLAVAADEGVSDADIDAFVSDFQANFVPEEADGDAAPEYQTASAGGRRLRYLRQGETGGTPMVMIHGFGGDLNSWMFNQPVLAERHDVIALDLPGHGGSEKDVGDGDVAALAGAVVDFLDEVDVAKAHLVGHSLGAACALQLALTQPNRVASVTAVCPAGLGAAINTAFIEGFISAKRPRQLRQVLGQLFKDPELVSREMIDEVLKFKRLDGAVEALQAVAASAFAGGQQALVLTESLGGLAVPGQIILGAHDSIVPAPEGDGWAGSLTVHRFDDCGHMAHMEAPAQVNALIAELAEA